MTFREILARIIDQTPGALAGAIMSRDGIPVEEYEASRPDVELSTVAVELESVRDQAGKVTAALFPGEELEELMLVVGNAQLLFRNIDEEYFLLVLLERGGVLGKARYLVRSILQELRQEL